MGTQTRELILHVGTDLFERRGYRDVNIAEIAKIAGISVGNFYLHFLSKDRLYTEILDHLETEGMRRADSLVARLRSPLNKIKVLYWFSALGLRKNRLLRGVLLHERKYMYPGLSLRAAHRGDLYEHLRRLVRATIREGMAKGFIRTGLYHDTTRLVLTIFDVVIHSLDRDDFEELLLDLLIFLQRGLRRFLRLRRRDERLDRRIRVEEVPRDLLR